VALVALQPDLVAQLWDRVFGQLETLTIDSLTDVNSAEVVRLNLTLMTFDVMSDYPLFGFGAGGAEAYCAAGNYHTFGVCVPHNWPLEMASNFGIPLAMLHVTAIIGLFVFLLRDRTAGSFRPTLMALFTCSIVANFTASSILVLPAIWIVLGTFVAYARIVYTQRKA